MDGSRQRQGPCSASHFSGKQGLWASHRVSWTDNWEGPADDLLPQIKRRLGAICDARVLMTNARFGMVVPRPVGLPGGWVLDDGKGCMRKHLDAMVRWLVCKCRVLSRCWCSELARD